MKKNITWLILFCSLVSFATAASYTLSPDPEPQTFISSDRLELESSPEVSTFLFKGNVIIRGNNLEAQCDEMYVMSSRSGDKNATIGQMGKIRSIEAIGNVRIQQGDRIAYAGKAIIMPVENKVILEESPVVIDGGSTVRGHRMVLFKGKRKAIVEGAEGGVRPTVQLPGLPNLGFDD